MKSQRSGCNKRFCFRANQSLQPTETAAELNDLNRLPVYGARRSEMAKVILDLCAGTGAWSMPYADAGYSVRLITLPEFDVRTYQPHERIHGVLAAPPCTDFTAACNRYWADKDFDGRTFESLGIVGACLRIIRQCKPKWWCLENPVGRLRRWIGPPVMYFHPYEYGDPYTKRTCLWGSFNKPMKNPVALTEEQRWQGKQNTRPLPSISKLTRRADLRAITPAGFAQAFFEANP